MAFTDSQKSQIRQWMGYADIFHDADPRLENAMLSVQQLPDGGAAEARIVAMLPKIQAAWDNFTNLDCLSNVQVGNVKMDAIRARAWARQIGPTLVGLLSDALRCRPARNIFAPPGTSQVERPFDGVSSLGGWPR